jgi:hypothetical protein
MRSGKNRDINAAENLNRAGLARIYACGHDGSASVLHVTETTSMGEAGSKDVQGALLSTLSRAANNE